MAAVFNSAFFERIVQKEGGRQSNITAKQPVKAYKRTLKRTFAPIAGCAFIYCAWLTFTETCTTNK